MSRKTIPESVRINCDFCGQGVGREENTIELDGNSVSGRTAVGPSYMAGKRDCCADCYNEVTILLKRLKDETR